MTKQHSSSRRSFIRNSGLLAGAGALSPAMSVKAFAQAAKNGQIITAAHWGPLVVNVDSSGKVTSSRPAVPAKLENPLQTVVADQIYNKVRIKQPMVRKGFLDNLDNVTQPDGKRGDDEFVPISWKEAYDLIEKQLRRVREAYGADGIFAGSYGWRSSGVLHKAFTLLQRFMTLSGGYVGHLGDYSTGAAQVIMPHVMGTVEVYEQPTSWEVVLRESKVVVIWSANIANSSQIAWSASDCQGRDYLLKLKESGIKVITIDPTLSETAEILGDACEWIPVNPTTDVPLMLGICHELIANDWHDKAFLEKYCVGADIVADYIHGKEDGIAKTPEWAAEICGVSAEKIRELAKLFHENRTMFMAGWAMQRQHHGEQTHWMLVTLAAFLGQIGLPGGGFGLSYHYSNGGVPERKAGVLPNIGITPSSGSSANNKDWLLTATELSFPVARISDALHNPGAQYPYNGQTRTYPHIRLIWWCGGNPFHHHQDLNRLRKGWQKPEVIIVSEPYWTATAKHADIVLPATTSYERNDLTMTGDYSNMHIVPMKKVVEPQGEAKDDYEVFAELSRRFGVEAEFTEGRGEMGWLAHLYGQAEAAARQQRIPMPRFRQFWDENKVYENPISERGVEWVRYADFRKDPVLNPLGTPSGKIELFSKTIEAMNYEDCRGHASWLPPVEYLGNAPEEYPLHMVTPHSHYRLHSQLNQTSLREQYAIANREPVWIHPEDAQARDIADGDLVRIYNGRGQVLAGAVVTERVAKRVLALHEGAWYDPADGSDNALCKNGCGNVLAIDRGTSSLAQGNTGQTAVVNIEKYSGEAPELTAFTPPKGAA